mmetsp:Transcript_8186/g.10644  ORF Transcript_8186/g.10644 Transcript_8186/m.10644 type:complete len:475 (-) Transcript_8186:56-1480(-)
MLFSQGARSVSNLLAVYGRLPPSHAVASSRGFASCLSGPTTRNISVKLVTQAPTPFKFPPVLRAQLRNFCANANTSSGAKNFAKSSTTNSSQNRFAKYALWNNTKFRMAFRVIRNVVIVASIGGSCFAMGQIEYIEDPEGFERKTVNTLMSKEQVTQMLLIDEDKNMSRDAYIKTGGPAYVFDAELQQLVVVEPENDIWVTGEKSQRVFRRIKMAAQRILKSNIDQIKAEIEASQDSPSLQLLLHEELSLLQVKQMHLAKSWKIVVTDNELPNAFVNGFLPRRIFLTKGLLKEFCKTEEELALVLSHELSHFLLGHTKDILMVNAVVQVIAVSLISIIDPTGGLGSFVLELVIPWLGSIIGASFSRDQEHQADDFGFEIIANACYEPRKALSIFGNMQAFTEKMKSEGFGIVVPMLSTHPMDEDRFRNQLENLEENREIYKNNNCDDSLIDKFFKIWAKPSANPSAMSKHLMRR